MELFCSGKAKNQMDCLAKRRSGAFLEISNSVEGFMKSPRLSLGQKAIRRTQHYVIYLSRQSLAGKNVIMVDAIFARKELSVERLTPAHINTLRLFSATLSGKIARRIGSWTSPYSSFRRQKAEPLSLEVRARSYSYDEHAILSAAVIQTLKKTPFAD